MLELSDLILKFCPDCKRKKPISNFHRHYARRDGLAAYCKLCLNERRKKFPHNKKAVA